MKSFIYETLVRDEWLDYNQHMRDANYGTVFSYAIDQFMVDVGMDEPYRTTTKGTLYVVEDHKFYLMEVKANSKIRVETNVIDLEAKKIHVHQRMLAGSNVMAICESLLLHVVQNDVPKAQDIPTHIAAVIQNATMGAADVVGLQRRSNRIAIKRR
ncbi:carnitine dehydrogenase [Mesorhizobium amorphae]|uniref:thioesterase family protein n=1 Tax=Mesorhizobium amorphae TaxID=71433 RepID=UPI00235C8CBE|nr:thioesterase family protein [Mesorhizobium amorphae]GLR45266.1 carnitine dehydrogenase [Mesorhizobium amorphae]